jgi:ElaB/YqjD/DUF883 family membrane-anchored ribosome-binding protein
MPDTPERRPSDVAPPAARATEPAIQPPGAGQQHSSASGDAAAAAKAQASAAGEQVRQQATQWAETAKNRGRRMLDEQKGNAVEQISGIARALHQSADQCMERDDERTAGRVLEQAAAGLDRLSDMLRSRDVDAMMDQATTLMRRQPALFIGGTAAAGFLLSRFLKSSNERSQGDGERRGEAHAGRAGGVSAEPSYDGASYVTSAHVNPGEVSGRSSAPPVTPTGRRDY